MISIYSERLFCIKDVWTKDSNRLALQPSSEQDAGDLGKPPHQTNLPTSHLDAHVHETLNVTIVR